MEAESKIDKLKYDFSCLKWAFRQIWDIDRKNMVFWTVLSIAGSIIPTFFIAITKNIVNSIEVNAKAQSGFQSIVYLIVILAMLQFLTSLYNILPTITRYSMHAKYAIGMQRRMGNLVRYVPLRCFDDPETATKFEAAQPTMKRLAYFLSSFVDLMSRLIGMVSLLILAANTSVLLLLAAVVLMSISIPVGIYNSRQSYKFWQKEVANNRLVDYYYNLAFDQGLAKEYRMFRLDRFIRKSWFNIVSSQYEKEVKYQNSQNLKWNINDTFNSFLKFNIAFIGLYLTGNGKLTLGGLTLFISLFDQLAGQSMNIGQKIMGTYRYIQDLGYQKDVFESDFSEKPPVVSDEDMRNPTPDKKDEAPAVFELKGVSYSYRPQKYALKGITLKIRKGEIVALVGSNGAGKSTLIKLLLGFYTPTEGQLFFENKNYSELDFTEFINRIGVTFQDYSKFEFTIRENIGFGDLSKINDDEALMDAIRNGGAEKIVARMPDKLDTYMGRWYSGKGTELSGGEWQRLAVSRAHLSNRDIMILDEPAAMLDPIAEMEQFNNVRNSIKGRTAILISHRIGFARLADKIAVLDEGKLVEYGTHDELMSKKGVYHRMFQGQAEWYRKEEGA